MPSTQLLLQILALYNGLSFGQDQDCLWPHDTGQSCEAQPVCPDCEAVVCKKDIQPDDCPRGTFYEADKLFGCCPACVQYLSYAEPCVGVVDQVLNYKGDVSKSNHQDDFPLKFVEETEELPCSKDLGPNSLSERVFLDGVYFDHTANVSIVRAATCAPGLECRAIKYEQPTTTTTASTSTTTPTTTSTLPTTSQSRDSFDGPIYSPIGDHLTEDPYPICNVPAPVAPDDKEGMDCVNRPCDCRKMDYKLWTSAEDCTRHEWNPECTNNGVFHPVQLRESRNIQYSPNFMWCSAPNGDRLFGAARERQGKENGMRCGCSRKRWELEQEKTMEKVGEEDFRVPARDDVSLHCDELGSYEQLQCDNGNCWCVQEQSGKAVSTVVPEALVKLLPCFNNQNEDDLEDLDNYKYMRKCETRAINVAKTQAKLRVHGTRWTPSSIYNCDYDGSFGPVHQYPTETRCQSASGKDDIYAAPNEEAAGMNCQCFRDLGANMPGVVNCQGNGNYPSYQTSNGREWCTDPQTGWRVSNAVDASKKCCLDSSRLPSLDLWGPQGHSEFKCRYGSEDTCDPCQEQMKTCI